MPAYALFDVLEVTDQAKMGQYRQGVLATIQKYGGRVIVAGGKFEIVEGSAKPENFGSRMVDRGSYLVKFS